MKGVTHKQAHPECAFGVTSWAACDKLTTPAYADWQAMQQVILAFNVVVRGDTSRWKKEKGQFGSLVRYISGDSDDMLDDDGNPASSATVMRLRAAIERFKLGDLPGYNLYTPIEARA